MKYIDLSRKNWWFQTIRALSIAAVVVMVIGIVLIANKDNSPPSLISSTCGNVICHAVMGYITPLIVVAYLLLFHFIFPPACTQLQPLCITMVLCVLCLIVALVLVIIDVVLGLVLFQTGCAPVDPLNDNLPAVLFLFFFFFLKFVMLCCLAFAECQKRLAAKACCNCAGPCTPNKDRCFKWGLCVFMIVANVIVMLFIMILIIISPNLGYINLQYCIHIILTYLKLFLKLCSC